MVKVGRLGLAAAGTTLLGGLAVAARVTTGTTLTAQGGQFKALDAAGVAFPSRAWNADQSPDSLAWTVPQCRQKALAVTRSGSPLGIALENDRRCWVIAQQLSDFIDTSGSAGLIGSDAAVLPIVNPPATGDDDLHVFNVISPTTANPTTAKPTTAKPTTANPTTANPTTAAPTTVAPTTASPTTAKPTTANPTTASPTTTVAPTTATPTSATPSTATPTTVGLITGAPTKLPTTRSPISAAPETSSPTTLQPQPITPNPPTPTIQPTVGTAASSAADAQPSSAGMLAAIMISGSAVAVFFAYHISKRRTVLPTPRTDGSRHKVSHESHNGSPYLNSAYHMGSPGIATLTPHGLPSAGYQYTSPRFQEVSINFSPIRPSQL